MILIVFIIIATYSLYVLNTYKGFNTNVHVMNKTSKNINANIDISILYEDAATKNSIFSLENIDSKDIKTSNIYVNTPKEDFGFVLKIEDSTYSYYFIRGSKLSYINIDIEIVDTSDGNIMAKGVVTRKNLFGTRQSEEIKEITLKGV